MPNAPACGDISSLRAYHWFVLVCISLCKDSWEMLGYDQKTIQCHDVPGEMFLLVLGSQQLTFLLCSSHTLPSPLLTYYLLCLQLQLIQDHHTLSKYLKQRPGSLFPIPEHWPVQNHPRHLRQEHGVSPSHLHSKTFPTNVAVDAVIIALNVHCPSREAFQKMLPHYAE